MSGDEKSSIHPDYGELDAYRRDESDAVTAEHVAHCNECQTRLGHLEEIAALLRDEPPVPPMPEHVKQQILWNAQKHGARIRRELRLAQIRRWAIAASVVLAVGALLVWRQVGRAPTGPHGPDAVDALLVARAMGPDRPATQRFDFNHDGMVDERDVDATMHQVVSVFVAPAQAQPLPTAAVGAEGEGEVRYRRIDIFVDAGSDGLAAYQVEITPIGNGIGVGIGGGDHPAFVQPAYYDPMALHRSGRIILAAISTAADLPRGRTRVATLSMREAGTVTYKIRLMAAARADGTRFQPAVSAVPEGGAQ